MKAVTLDQARAAKQKLKERLAGLSGLAGIGLTETEEGYGVKVNLAEPPTVPLPEEVDGVPIIVDVVGKIRKLPA